jgi:hypothetical protein
MPRFALILGALVLSGSAWAGPVCTTEPRSKWISEADMKAKIATGGFKYSVFKVTTGNCYEIYGRDSSGKRVEIYFHPLTGAVVEQH